MPNIFRTKNVPFDLPALYQLSLRAPGQQFAELSTYTFPLTPSSLRSETTDASTFNDTQGPVLQNGINRVMDVFGISPPVFTIEGTTGWDRHLADGYVLTGMQSMQLLVAFIQKYKQLNQTQIAAGNSNLYALEFYDYFSTQFWQIEPIGPQIVQQTNDRPLLTYYRFRWAAIRPVRFPVLGELDAVARTFATPAEQAAANAAQSIGAMLIAYTPTGVTSGILSALP